MVTPKRTPTSHSYFSKRLRLHYLDWGSEGAPPLLMIHGNRDHCHNWDWLAERLADDFHIMAPDLRGHGDSQWNLGSAYPLSEYVYDVAQLVRQTKMAPVRIVAHSLGGNVAMQYAGTFPEEVIRVVSIEGYGHLPQFAVPPAPDRLRAWVERGREIAGRSPRRYRSLEEALARMREANPQLSPEQARHLTIHGANQNEDGTYSWKFDNYVHLNAPADFLADEVASIWAQVACPVLFLSGAESWATPSDFSFLENLRDVRLEIVARAGHWVHHDQLDLVTNLVADFLR